MFDTIAVQGDLRRMHALPSRQRPPVHLTRGVGVDRRIAFRGLASLLLAFGFDIAAQSVKPVTDALTSPPGDGTLLPPNPGQPTAVVLRSTELAPPDCEVMLRICAETPTSWRSAARRGEGTRGGARLQ
jgi:hypothetical protein